MRKSIVKLASPLDISELVELQVAGSKRVFSEYYGFEPKLPDKNKRWEIWHKRFLQKTHVVYMFYFESNLVGYVAIGTTNAKQAELSGLYVAQNFTGQGFGGKMLDFCLELLKKYNFKSCRLEVLEKNQRACKLYKDRGFNYTHVARTIDLDGNEYKFWEMIKIF